MPRRKILTISQKNNFNQIPTTEDLLIRYYTLSDQDLYFIKKRRGNHNKLGIAIQLGLMRYPGRIMASKEILPTEFINFIASQLELNPKTFNQYALRDTTRKEHSTQLMHLYGFKSLTKKQNNKLEKWLTPIAIDNPKGLFLFGALINEIRNQKILYYNLDLVEDIVSKVIRKADTIVYDKISQRLLAYQKSMLNSWIQVDPKLKMSVLSWLKQPVLRATPSNFLLIVKKLDYIRSVNLSKKIFQELSSIRFKKMVNEVNRISIQHLRDLHSQKKYTLLVCFLIEYERLFTDQALNLHDKMMKSINKKCKHKYQELFQQDQKQTKKTIQLFHKVGKLIIQSHKNNQNPLILINKKIKWEDFCIAVEQANMLSFHRKSNPLFYIENYYSYIRKYSIVLLNTFNFYGASAGKDLLEALCFIKQLNNGELDQLPLSVPRSFIPKVWKSFIIKNKKINRKYYELCVLEKLSDYIRSGDLWVKQSKQFQAFDSYLFSQENFNKLLKQNNLPLSIDIDCESYLLNKQKILTEKLNALNDSIKNNRLGNVLIKNGKISIGNQRSNKLPENLNHIIRTIYKELPQIKITDLLFTVNQWTKFSEQFTHVKTGLPHKDQNIILTTILSDGINLDLKRMAQACPEYSINKLRWAYSWYTREECYSKALSEIINVHLKTNLISYWGDGLSSSSDGQRFGLSHIGQNTGEVNLRYGNSPGVLFYTHISDQYSPFYTKIINATIRDATHILDGLLYHDTNLNIEEHYTDTAGFTDHVFALCHFLGFKFSPRIRNFGDLKLSSIQNTKEWETIHPLFGDPIKINIIKQQWHDILRLISSIGLGTVKSSVIIKKLAAYPKQNKLALALRELGRIERSIYMIQWIEDTSFRRRVQQGLNKGEARNALAKVVFFNKNGKLTDRSMTNQYHKASGLNLIVAAIILWNTIELEKAIDRVKQKIEVPEQALKHLSPIVWDHINLTGDYHWKNP